MLFCTYTREESVGGLSPLPFTPHTAFCSHQSKKTAAAHLTKKTPLYLDLQQLPTDKGKKVESIVQPGLSAYQEGKPSCLLLGFFQVWIGGSDPAFGANIDPEYRSGATAGVQHRKAPMITIHFISVNMMLTYEAG